MTSEVQTDRVEYKHLLTVDRLVCRARNHELVEVRIQEPLSRLPVAEWYTSLACNRKVVGSNPGGCVLPMIPTLV